MIKTYSRVDTVFAILDEDWNFSCSRRFEDLGQLRYGLLENLRRADVYFGDDHHDWDIQS